MLNQVIFILKTSRSVYIQSILADIRQVCGILKDNASVKIMIEDETDIQSFIIKKYDRGTLFIADSGETMNRLLDNGYFAIGLLHEYNRDQDFGRALYVMTDIKEMECDSFLKVYERLAGLPWHIADTERLTIRETIEADVEDFYCIYQEPSITVYTEGLFQDVEEEKAYVREYIKKIYGFYGYGVWTILLKDTKEVIGRAGLSWREGYKYPELGFVIAVGHQQRGYAEEACRKILQISRDELEFEYVQALVETGNISSMKLCHKLGFVHKENVSVREKMHSLLIKKL